MAKKTNQAADEAATENPTEMEPMTHPSADPVLAESDTGTAESAEFEDDADNTNDQTDANMGGAELMRMCRDAPIHDGGPTTAEVHPDEVDHWLKAGWELDDDD